MRSTQRAAILQSPQNVVVVDVPMPGVPGPGEVSVRIDATGICGSDLHTYLDGRIGATVMSEPTILGHEFAGQVVAVGENARDGTGRNLEAGQRVAVDPARPCGCCELCRLGHPNLCTDLDFTGMHPVAGALQQFLIVPAETCFPIPDTISNTEAAMLEPLGIAIHAISLAHIKPGDTVAIVGMGTIGLCSLQVAQASGPAEVFATDRLGWRLDAASRFGARTVDVTTVDAVAEIMAATSGRGVDIAIECAWSSEEAIAQAVDVLRPGGRLVVVGIAADDRLTFSHSAVRSKGLTIALARRMKHTYPRAITMVEAGRVDIGELATDHVDLDGAAGAFADAANYRDGIIKAIVHPHGYASFAH